MRTDHAGLLLVLLVLLLPGCPDPGDSPDAVPADPEWLGRNERTPMPTPEFVPPTVQPVAPGDVVNLPDGGPRVAKGQYVVRLRRGAPEDKVIAWIRDRGLTVEVLGRVPSARLLQVRLTHPDPAAALDTLRACPFLEAADYNLVVAPPPPSEEKEPPHAPAVGDRSSLPNDPVFHDDDAMNDWGLMAIRAPEAWRITRGRPEVVIAVVDDGCDLNHEELAGKTVDPWDVTSKSEGQNRATLEADCDHGTHVAITAAGHVDNGKGTAGVAPGCSVMPVQIFEVSEGSAYSTMAFLTAGIERARAMGAEVINVSIGSSWSDELLAEFRDPDTRPKAVLEMEQIRDRGLSVMARVLGRARAEGIIVVGSAGNADIPAVYDDKNYTGHIITVGAANRLAEDRFERRKSSNYGDHVTLAAPGGGIYSGTLDSRYTVKNGTSMASPHVAGVVALMKSVDEHLSFEEAREILISTATVPVQSEAGKSIGNMVDARAAVVEVMRRREKKKIDDPLPPSAQVRIYRIATGGMNPWGTPYEYTLFHPGEYVHFEIDHGVFYEGAGLKVRVTHEVFGDGGSRPIADLTATKEFPHPSPGKWRAGWATKVPASLAPGSYDYVGTIELLDGSGKRLAVDQRATGFTVEAVPSEPPPYNPVQVAVRRPVPPRVLKTVRGLSRPRFVWELGQMLDFGNEQFARFSMFTTRMQSLTSKWRLDANGPGVIAGMSARQRVEFGFDIDSIEDERTRLIEAFRGAIMGRFRSLLGQEGQGDLGRTTRDFMAGVLRILELGAEVGSLQRRMPGCRSEGEVVSLFRRMEAIQKRVMPIAQAIGNAGQIIEGAIGTEPMEAPPEDPWTPGGHEPEPPMGKLSDLQRAAWTTLERVRKAVVGRDDSALRRLVVPRSFKWGAGPEPELLSRDDAILRILRSDTLSDGMRPFRREVDYDDAIYALHEEPLRTVRIRMLLKAPMDMPDGSTRNLRKACDLWFAEGPDTIDFTGIRFLPEDFLDEVLRPYRKKVKKENIRNPSVAAKAYEMLVGGFLYEHFQPR